MANRGEVNVDSVIWDEHLLIVTFIYAKGEYKKWTS
ncbi:MAG: hypothetical protein JWQ21_821 [Herminiimonas sp.]|nr:hypothetical protein [Herminiimonas sp.]